MQVLNIFENFELWNKVKIQINLDGKQKRAGPVFGALCIGWENGFSQRVLLVSAFSASSDRGARARLLLPFHHRRRRVLQPSRIRPPPWPTSLSLMRSRWWPRPARPAVLPWRAPVVGALVVGSRVGWFHTGAHIPLCHQSLNSALLSCPASAAKMMAMPRT